LEDSLAALPLEATGMKLRVMTAPEAKVADGRGQKKGKSTGGGLMKEGGLDAKNSFCRRE
jgi:hypothetical protein